MPSKSSTPASLPTLPYVGFDETLAVVHLKRGREKSLGQGFRFVPPNWAGMAADALAHVLSLLPKGATLQVALHYDDQPSAHGPTRSHRVACGYVFLTIPAETKNGEPISPSEIQAVGIAIAESLRPYLGSPVSTLGTDDLSNLVSRLLGASWPEFGPPESNPAKHRDVLVGVLPDAAPEPSLSPLTFLVKGHPAASPGWNCIKLLGPLELDLLHDSFWLWTSYRASEDVDKANRVDSATGLALFLPPTRSGLVPSKLVDSIWGTVGIRADLPSNQSAAFAASLPFSVPSREDGVADMLVPADIPSAAAMAPFACDWSGGAPTANAPMVRSPRGLQGTLNLRASRTNYSSLLVGGSDSSREAWAREFILCERHAGRPVYILDSGSGLASFALGLGAREIEIGRPGGPSLNPFWGLSSLARSDQDCSGLASLVLDLIDEQPGANRVIAYDNHTRAVTERSIASAWANCGRSTDLAAIRKACEPWRSSSLKSHLEHFDHLLARDLTSLFEGPSVFEGLSDDFVVFNLAPLLQAEPNPWHYNAVIAATLLNVQRLEWSRGMDRRRGMMMVINDVGPHGLRGSNVGREVVEHTFRLFRQINGIVLTCALSADAFAKGAAKQVHANSAHRIVSRGSFNHRHEMLEFFEYPANSRVEYFYDAIERSSGKDAIFTSDFNSAIGIFRPAPSSDSSH